MGMPVVEAAQVDEALTLLDQLVNITAVISDIVMPGERHGLDLAQHLENTRPDINVLLVSGLPRNHELLEKAKKQFTVLQKPLDSAELKPVLISMIGDDPNRKLP
jgi:DNA-binding NtrC family response regulator